MHCKSGVLVAIQKVSLDLFHLALHISCRAEYETSQSSISTEMNALQNHDVTCSICMTGEGKPHSFVRYAQTSCPSGYEMDYRGYVMSSLRSGAVGAYVDNDPLGPGIWQARSPSSRLLMIFDFALLLFHSTGQPSSAWTRAQTVIRTPTMMAR